MAVARPAVADIGREVWGPVERHWRETIGTWLVANSTLTPYNTNPLGVNPLRDAIVEHVDIDAIRSSAAPAALRHGDQRQVGAARASSPTMR